MSRSAGGTALSVERFFQLSLLGLVTCGYLAVAGSGYLDAPTIVLTAAGLILRGCLVTGLLRFEISDRYVTAATLAYIGFYPVDYLFVSRGFLEATVHLVFFLAVMKILTARTARDYLYTATIAFLELMAAAILSVSLNFFIFLALFLLFAIAAFTSSEIRHCVVVRPKIARSGLRRFNARLAGLAAFITLGILSLTAGLFFLLPRTADAALRRFVSQRYYLPGFSNQVLLGQIGEIKTQSRAVMHVRLYNNPAPRLNLKWRGAALSNFDGKKWFNPSSSGDLLRAHRDRVFLADDWQRRRVTGGRRILYRVDLNAIDTDALFFAGIPEVLNLSPSVVIRTPTDSYRLGFVPSEPFRYEVSSFVEDPLSTASVATQPVPIRVRQEYLQLPVLDPRVPALAASLVAGISSDFERVRALEKHLREDYGYTLELPAREPADPLADFLFARKKGHCEYFASAMAVMLRTTGIPSRLVTGFQSGTWNPVSEQYLIRALDAHSWVEAYLPGRGWTTWDPTPPDPGVRLGSLWMKLLLYVDAADTFWQEWVLSYDLGRQVTLAERLQQSTRRFGVRWLDHLIETTQHWKDRVHSWSGRYGRPVLLAGAIAALLAFLAPRGWRWLRMHHRVRRLRRGQASVTDATLLYDRMLDLLRRRGYHKPSWLTPCEFADSLPPSPAGVLVHQFTSAYNALRFGGRLQSAPRMTVLLEELERQEH
jgi:hypothetical protein